MIKFTMRLTEGRTLLGLGLVEQNLELLQKGRPIMLTPEDLHWKDVKDPVDVTKLQIMIFYGKDEADIARQLEQYMSPETKRYDDRKGG